MNIVTENIDDLNAIIKVKIAPSDYSERYEEALKKHQKKVDVPGFRHGHTPLHMVKQRFGRQVLLEEINRMLSESLHKYISDNKMEILGNPLPKMENHIDLESQKEMEFQFDIGIAPKINVELSANEKYPYYSIKTDDALIDKHVEAFRKNFGHVIHPEVSADKDILAGDFAEVDAQGHPVAGGFLKASIIDTGRISSQVNRNKLIGLKTDGKILLDKLSDDAAYFSETLELPLEKITALTLQFVVRSLNRIVPAEVNQDLFDKIYGPGKINSGEEFRNKIREELAIMFVSDTDRRFFNDVIESLMKKADITLPEIFLKKFILITSKEKISIEQIDREYGSYAKALSWQLIENHLLKTYKIVVPVEEVQQFVSNAVKMNLVRQGLQNVTEDELNGQVKRILEDEKQVRGAYARLYDQKLIELFKKNLTLEKKEVSYDDFFNAAKSR